MLDRPAKKIKGAATRPKLHATRRRKSAALRQPPAAHHRRASHRDNDSVASPLHSWGCARRRPRRRRRWLIFDNAHLVCHKWARWINPHLVFHKWGHWIRKPGAMHLGIFVMYNIGQYPLGVPQVGSMDLAGNDYSDSNDNGGDGGSGMAAGRWRRCCLRRCW